MTCGHRRLAAGGGVVDAQRLAALVDAVEAVGGADARPDAMFFARMTFPTMCGIGDVGARHADHVELASAMAWRAVATSEMRAAWKTGNFVAARTSPAKSRCGSRRACRDRDDTGQRRVVSRCGRG
jgi:hypothetical protein